MEWECRANFRMGSYAVVVDFNTPELGSLGINYQATHPVIGTITGTYRYGGGGWNDDDIIDCVKAKLAEEIKKLKT